MTTFATRLNACMQKEHLNAGQLALLVGVSRQSVVFWQKGRNEPKPEALAKLADALRVNKRWLLTGQDDEAFAPVIATEDIKDRDEYVWIPEYKLEFSCGCGCEAPEWIEQDSASGYAYKMDFFTSRRISPAKCRRVLAEGDSMEPRICDGDHVMFVMHTPGAPIRDGKIYAISYGGALRIKRLYRKANGDLVIHSDNPAYEEEIVPAKDVDAIIKIHGLVIDRSGSV